MSKNKKAANDQESPSHGHNSLTDDIKAKYQNRDLEIVKEIAELNEQRKQNLREAKDAGMKKMSIRGATKEILMSEEQLQAKREVEHEKKDYAKIWHTVFAEAEKAA